MGAYLLEESLEVYVVGLTGTTQQYGAHFKRETLAVFARKRYRLCRWDESSTGLLARVPVSNSGSYPGLYLSQARGDESLPPNRKMKAERGEQACH